MITSSVESMPISVLKVGSYIIVKNDLSFKGFPKFPEIFEEVELSL
jgi:hypothetical protein